MSNSLRFVLLHHRLPDDSVRMSHWDLMIETGDSLLTFELQSLPGNLSSSLQIAWPVTRLPDHRLHYLNYEGVIAPLGQDDLANKVNARQAIHRGSVRRIAAGRALCHRSEPSGPVRCLLQSAELSAQFTYAICRPGEATLLQIDSWHWATNPES